MRYISTRGASPTLSFEDAVLTGLACDGGLYVPEFFPALSAEDIAGFAGQIYEDVAFIVMKPFIGDAFTDTEFREIIARAYSVFGHDARCPLKQLAHNHFLLELFHGPTLAFKDVAMQLIGQMFQVALGRAGKSVTIVGATSGDTGSAAMEAFRGLDAVNTFIMYPHGRVSEVQRRQMTCVAGDNVHALAVDGDFDTCQALLKDMFSDFDFRDRMRLASVNSINWARILAQVVYYFTSAVALGAPYRAVSFCVPTGNFGDIFAGYVAKRMGLPIDRLVIATNQNDILHRTLQSGVHEKNDVIPSISPSMDIQVSSNFERLVFDLYDRKGSAVAQLFDGLRADGRFDLSPGALSRLRNEFDSGRVSEAETSRAITDFMRRTGAVLCPHTAIGALVAERQVDASDTPVITLATAHPAKFPDAIEAAVGVRPNLPKRMVDLFDLEERATRVAGDLAMVESVIRERTNI
ncbi:MAG: threonine synthase [Rhodobacteraceae bacterium]|nr:threonine synthase [Paracoccaceae bacterium]